MRFIGNPGKYVLPYFTRRGAGPLGSPAGFDAIGNIRTGLDNSTRYLKMEFSWNYFAFFLVNKEFYVLKLVGEIIRILYHKSWDADQVDATKFEKFVL